MGSTSKAVEWVLLPTVEWVLLPKLYSWYYFQNCTMGPHKTSCLVLRIKQIIIDTNLSKTKNKILPTYSQGNHRDNLGEFIDYLSHRLLQPRGILRGRRCGCGVYILGRLLLLTRLRVGLLNYGFLLFGHKHGPGDSHGVLFLAGNGQQRGPLS